MSKTAELEVTTPEPPRYKTLWIKVADIIPTKDNTRDFEDPARQESLKELAQTIKEKGLLHPIVVRPHPTKPGKYDLRAGERRWRAHQIAGFEKIEARVRTMNDLEAEEATFIENYQREQLTPMETAQGIQNLLESKNSKITLREMSLHLGMTVSMVLRRARLTALIKPWQKAMESATFPKWGLGHYMSLARFEPAAQNQLYEQITEWSHPYENMTLAQFEKHLANQTRLISLAKWDPEDETLIPKAGSCTKCPYNSGCKPGLFDAYVEAEKSGKKNKCTHLACWEAKDTAHHERAKMELQKKHPNLVIHTSRFNQRDGALPGPEAFDLAKKSEPGAYLALWDDGEDRGKLFWAKPKARGKALKKAHRAEKGQDPAPTPLNERREAYTKRRNVHVLQAFAALLSEGKIGAPSASLVVSLAAVFGTEHNQAFVDPDSWNRYDALMQSGKADLCVALWASVAPVLSKRLRSAAMDMEPRMEEAARLAALLSVDLPQLEAEALTAIPDPKVWATLNEDGTKKRPMSEAA